jgi:NADPH-dependent 7-cyano-7-deazaguanine reductase QueF
MPRCKLITIANPRKERHYHVTLSMEQPLSCWLEACDQEGMASFDLEYVPRKRCIAGHSFGQYLALLLRKQVLNRELLQGVLEDVSKACNPSMVQIRVRFESTTRNGVSFAMDLTEFPR